MEIFLTICKLWIFHLFQCSKSSTKTYLQHCAQLSTFNPPSTASITSKDDAKNNQTRQGEENIIVRSLEVIFNQNFNTKCTCDPGQSCFPPFPAKNFLSMQNSSKNLAFMPGKSSIVVMLWDWAWLGEMRL